MTQVKPDADREIPVAQAVMTQHWEATSGSQPALPTSAPGPTKQTPLKSNPFVSPSAVFLSLRHSGSNDPSEGTGLAREHENMASPGWRAPPPWENTICEWRTEAVVW